jgi:hypothetical protein
MHLQVFIKKFEIFSGEVYLHNRLRLPPRMSLKLTSNLAHKRPIFMNRYKL